MHNADGYGLNAYEELQDIYGRSREDTDRAYETIRAFEKFDRHKLREERDKNKRNFKIPYVAGGLAVGGGLGYAVGRKWAKRTPLTSQQRKRKLISTIIGAGVGAGVGNTIGNKRFKKIDKETWIPKAKELKRNYRKSYRDLNNEVYQSNRVATSGIPNRSYRSNFDRRYDEEKERQIKHGLTEDFKVLVPEVEKLFTHSHSKGTPESSSNIDKFNKKFGKFRKK
jgi:hypothetical protein